MTGRSRGRRKPWRPTAALSAAALAVATSMAALALVPAAAASTAAMNNIVITAFTDPGVNIGNGVPQEFDRTNASFSGTLRPRYISLIVTGGTAGKSAFWVFQVEPPPGTTFHVGYYPRVESLGGQAWGIAGLSISGGEGCGGTISGGVEVRDVATSGSRITRLDLLYEQHCDGAPGAIFGEIRIGEPQTTRVIVSSGSITWPVTPGIGRGSGGPAVPVYVRNADTRTLHVGTLSLRGLAAADFSMISDTCSGTTLAPGTSCAVELGFSAPMRGPRTAALRIAVGARAYLVQLDALVRPGTTSLVMQSQPGDPVGNGGSYDFTTSNSYITAAGSPFGIASDIHGSTQSWGAGMTPPLGEVLTAGTYSGTAYYNGLVVEHGGICSQYGGSFTVKQAIFSALDNSLKNFDATFTQHCGTASAALTGEFKYDAEPVTSAAAVSRLKAKVTRSGLVITWANPASARYRYTLIRIEPSRAPAETAPYAGISVYGGAGTRVTARGLIAGRAYTVLAYAVDRYGNISDPARYTVTRY